jgi:hypothetical protein
MACTGWHTADGVERTGRLGVNRDGAEVRTLGRACKHGQILVKLGAETKNAA